MKNIIKGKKGVRDEAYERIVGYHFPSLPKARELLSCAEAVQIHGFLWFAGNGSSQGFQTSITELAKIGMCSEHMVRDCLKEMEQCKLLKIFAPRGKPKFYKAFQDPKNHPDNQDPLQNAPMTPDENDSGFSGKFHAHYKEDDFAPNSTIEDNRYHTSYDVNDPSGTFTDVIYSQNPGQTPGEESTGHISKNLISKTWLENDRINSRDMQRDEGEFLGFSNRQILSENVSGATNVPNATNIPNATLVEYKSQKISASECILNNGLDASSKKIGRITRGNDKTPTSAKKMAKNRQYVHSDGTVWESLDAFFASISENAPDEDAPRRVWINDVGEEDYKRSPMSEIEQLIVSWMKAHGSKINRLSPQSMNKLKSRLPNSNETLLMVGTELWKAPEVQKRLTGIAKRPSVGYKIAFNQNEIVNILMDEYQAWRKTRDAQRANPEIAQLESALVEALGFTMQSIPARSLIYLRDYVIPQLFAADCRAQHVRPLIEGMKERKLGFIVSEWTARKKSLEYLTPKAVFVPAPFENPFED